MSRYLFIGPSLGSEASAQINGDLKILPPVKHGDLLRLPLERGDVVGIVDGYFHQVPAVRHKEILLLLKNGVSVLGAASMGALRAVELEKFGMEGYGRIFESYRCGAIDGDDEVAVLHGSEEEGYPVLSEALFNIRHNLGRARDRGICSEETYELLIEISSRMPYIDRTYKRIFQMARGKGTSPDELQRVERFLQRDYVDVKEQDALLLIEKLKLRAEGKATGSFDHEINETFYLKNWAEHLSGIEFEDVGLISITDVVRFCQLYAKDFPSLNEQIALRAYALHFAHELGLVDANEIVNIGRFIPESTPPEEHLKKELNALEILRNYLGMDQLEMDAFLKGVLVKYAEDKRLIKKTEDREHSPEWIKVWLDLDEGELPFSEQFTKFAARSLCLTQGISWMGLMLNSLKANGSLETAVSGVREIKIYNQDIQETHPEYREDTIKEDRVKSWFKKRWGQKGNFDLALMGRGFPDQKSFVKMAQPYYLYDRFAAGYHDFTVCN